MRARLLSLPAVMTAGYLFASALNGEWLPNLWVLLVALLSYMAGRVSR